MLDAAVVELRAQCLTEAAVYDGREGDLARSPTAFACELADTDCDAAVALLDVASRAAVAYLDSSDLVRLRIAPRHPRASQSTLEPDSPWQTIGTIAKLAFGLRDDTGLSHASR